jgi:predicted nuclease of predicted toxin-antitoxin system
MKVLLDEQINIKLLPLLEKGEIHTVHDFDWAGLKNGELREVINKNGFDILLSVDKNMPFEQNLNKMSFKLVILDMPSLSWRFQALFADKINTLLEMEIPNNVKLVYLQLEDLPKSKKIDQIKKRLMPYEVWVL